MRAPLVSLVLAGALAAAPLTGQGRYLPPEGQDPVLVRGVEFDRLDESLGEPRLVGHEQGDNDFRGRTPALARGNRSIAPVDVERLHRRKIAMYEDGEVFTSFLPVEGDEPAAMVNRAEEAEPEPRRTPLWRWIVLGGFVVISLLLAKTALGRRP
jgi:hypothetical protein